MMTNSQLLLTAGLMLSGLTYANQRIEIKQVYHHCLERDPVELAQEDAEEKCQDLTGYPHAILYRQPIVERISSPRWGYGPNCSLLITSKVEAEFICL